MEYLNGPMQGMIASNRLEEEEKGASAGQYVYVDDGTGFPDPQFASLVFGRLVRNAPGRDEARDRDDPLQQAGTPTWTPPTCGCARVCSAGHLGLICRMINKTARPSATRYGRVNALSSHLHRGRVDFFLHGSPYFVMLGPDLMFSSTSRCGLLRRARSGGVWTREYNRRPVEWSVSRLVRRRGH